MDMKNKTTLHLFLYNKTSEYISKLHLTTNKLQHKNCGKITKLQSKIALFTMNF